MEDGAPVLAVRSTASDDGRAELVLEGEVDVASARVMTEAVDQLVAAGTTYLELDFAGVTFMDSSGLGAVIHAHRVMSRSGGTLALGPRSRIVDRLFDVSGVERALLGNAE